MSMDIGHFIRTTGFTYIGVEVNYYWYFGHVINVICHSKQFIEHYESYRFWFSKDDLDLFQARF